MTLDTIKYSASLNQPALFAQATDHVQDRGPAQVSGVTTHHYALDVVVDKLPADFPQIEAIKSVGIQTIPIELWTDAQGRPVQMTEDLAVDGQRSSTKVNMSNFNRPVTITAPPADQVATR